MNFRFSKSFDEAIEAKTTTEQLKLKADRDLERIKVEAEQRAAMAQAEAASLRAQKEQITPEILKLREIENQREAIKKWNGVLPQFSEPGRRAISSGEVAGHENESRGEVRMANCDGLTRRH